MEIIEKPIDSLKVYTNNARTHSEQQIAEIMNSVQNFGFLDPIEIGEDNIVISGHARLAAARKLGLTHVPTITHRHLDPNARKAYILAANRLAMSAGWDSSLLQEELGELKDADFDLSLTGFTDEEIENYLNPEILNDSLEDEDGEQSLGQGQDITLPGDMWVLGEHLVKCGDSTCATDVDELLDGHKPNLMVTDPPYGVDYDPEWREEACKGVGERSKGKVKNDDRIDWTDVYSLFPGNVMYVWHAGKYSATVSKNIEDCGFEIVSQIIWAKQHFALSRGDYHWQHEPCWYAVRKGKKHSWRGKRDQSTLWEIKNNNAFGNSKTEETFGHGTQKPMECMARPIENNSKPNEYIYDPFGRSGTTLMACEKLGRKCLTMEIDPRYVDMIIRRWQKATGKQALSAETGEVFGG